MLIMSLLRALPLVLLCLATPLRADLSGPVQVVAGDTLRVGAVLVRLYGIDAPGPEGRCGAAADWSCGAWVAGEVRARYAGRVAKCVALERDIANRVVARCRIAGEDLGAALVAGGLAFALRPVSEAYVPQEQSARARRAGLHAAGVSSRAALRPAAPRKQRLPVWHGLKATLQSPRFDTGQGSPGIPASGWFHN